MNKIFEIKNMNMSPEDFHLMVRRIVTDCNRCVHMPINEREQRKIKNTSGELLDHICDLYNIRCLHEGFHPSIKPCKECDGKDFKSINEI